MMAGVGGGGGGAVRTQVHDHMLADVHVHDKSKCDLTYVKLLEIFLH